MKRIFSLLVVVSLVISLLGCSANDSTVVKDDPGLVGYVMSKEGDRILVVSDKAQDFSSTGGIDEFYDAISFSKAPKDIKIGDKVKVWFDVVAESYPGQSEVKSIELIASQKTNGSDLSESEALNKALTSKEVENKVAAVKSIEYNAQQDKWNIKIKDISSDKTYELNIDDK